MCKIVLIDYVCPPHFLKQRQLEALGAGQFGKVYKGHWTYSGQVIDVAIKVLSSESDQHSKIKFLQEAAIMSQFRHPNVIKLYGVVRDNDQVCTYLRMLIIRSITIFNTYVLNMHIPDYASGRVPCKR